MPIALTDADADLIALCAGHVGYGTQFNTLNEQGLTTDELVEDLCNDQHDVGTDILDLEVKTLAGAIAVGMGAS